MPCAQLGSYWKREAQCGGHVVQWRIVVTRGGIRKCIDAEMSYSFGLFSVWLAYGFLSACLRAAGPWGQLFGSLRETEMVKRCFNSDPDVVWYSEGSLHDKVLGSVGHKVHEGALSNMT